MPSSALLRFALSRHEPARIQPGGAVAFALEHQQANQRLRPAQQRIPIHDNS
jgi:hypothetical protein